mgnify:CR=1 FL=1
MTISIKANDDGKVQTIYHDERSGDEWNQLPDSALPTVEEDNVSKTYWFDGDELSVVTEPIPEENGL